MATLADRTITALRENHDTLQVLVTGLSDERLEKPSGSSDWLVAQVLSHLGSGSEIALAGLRATLEGADAPAQDFNQSVWDRWNAMTPRQQADGFLEHNEKLVGTFERIDAATRATLEIKLGFLPAPLPLASVAGMRLNEAVLHDWDVQVAFNPDAALPAEHAGLLLEHLSGGLSFLPGFIGKADAFEGEAIVAIGDDGFGIVIGDTVSVTSEVAAPSATLTGPVEAAARLVAGRLTPAHTPAGVAVTGNISLDGLRAVFPGY